ncbi:MAG: hypothetical protein AB3N13_05050 [Arenibacterium sp.]
MLTHTSGCVSEKSSPRIRDLEPASGDVETRLIFRQYPTQGEAGVSVCLNETVLRLDGWQMNKIVVMSLICALLAACGGRSDRERATVARAANGPIAVACLQAGRKAANRQLCGCVQAVANETLSGGDQRRGAKFFADPALAHSVWRSDTRADDEFWERWKTFAASASKTCKGR